MQLTFYGIYLFLAVFIAGNMTTLQIQHYGIYKLVGKENFKNYMQANNKSALVPSILPAIFTFNSKHHLTFYKTRIYVRNCNHSVISIKYHSIGFNLYLAKKTPG